ncbi:MAG: hypothetical protein IJ985_08195 [Akkermansia sp.]|nr:hypothetical protein [Akkermansia sp.]
MDSLPGDDSQAFSLFLDDELKAQIDSFSAKLGLSQRRFVELAVNAYLRCLSDRGISTGASQNPQIFLSRLLKRQER